MGVELDLLIEDQRWADFGLGALSLRAAEAALAHLGYSGNSIEISVLACDDARIATLNADFRGKAAPTNVLSWPAQDLAAETAGQAPRSPEEHAFAGEEGLELGDIAIAYDTCAKEAASAGKPLADHVSHLMVHGVLHLLGYDHIRDQDATLMERLEVEILGKLGITDPYST